MTMMMMMMMNIFIEEKVLNAFETWCWRRMLKTKRTDRITKDEVYQRAKEERLLLKIKKKKNGNSWIGRTIGYNEFVVNILEGAISVEKAVGRPRLQYLTLRQLMSYIYGAPILDVSRSHTTTHHSR